MREGYKPTESFPIDPGAKTRCVEGKVLLVYQDNEGSSEKPIPVRILINTLFAKHTHVYVGDPQWEKLYSVMCLAATREGTSYYPTLELSSEDFAALMEE